MKLALARRYFFLFLSLLPCAVAPASAQSVEDFYKAKNLTLVIASGVGGGYDVYGRLLARHLGKYIPGKPNIIVQNMDGAAGLRAINWLANVAPRDGSVIQETYNNLTVQPLVSARGTEYDPLKLRWIGSSGTQLNICVTWYTSPIKSLDQAKTREVTASATGADGNPAILPNILNHLIGTKFKIISGYNTAGSHLALERGEVESICGLAYSTLLAAQPAWFSEHKLNFLTQFGLRKNPDLPDVPMVADQIKNPADHQIFDLLAVMQDMGRPYVAPPGVPEDRLAALRKGFDAVMKDPEFLDESKKALQEVNPMTGADMEASIKAAYALPKSVIDRYGELIASVEVVEKPK
jgi:tripartite-type tricarboxylate transporter receptor subunit TctC